MMSIHMNSTHEWITIIIIIIVMTNTMKTEPITKKTVQPMNMDHVPTQPMNMAPDIPPNPLLPITQKIMNNRQWITML